MKSTHEIWAIVPTRGGSKGLPEKNIRKIAGKPMLHFMLTAAKKSKHIARLFLTTDNDDIAKAASNISGVEVLRHDPIFSQSGKPTFGVFEDTLRRLVVKCGLQPKAVALLRVTTPLCLTSDIDNCIELLLTNEQAATSVLSVVRSDVHPKRVYRIDNAGLLVARETTPETDFPLPRQAFDSVYLRNGAVYVTYPEIVFRSSLWGDRPLAYVMPKERSININDEIDFILVNELLKRQRSEQ
jgi:CMP-N,N'-diacetyllegionaminic acid synthase